MKELHLLSDTGLIHCFLKGNEKAFDVLFQRYRESIFKLLVHYVKDRDLAEDMTQEVFIKIFLSVKSSRYGEEGRFRNWALRIAHNHCMDHLRKPLRHVSDLSAPGVARGTEPSPEMRLIQTQTAARLHTLINKLPPEQKQVLYYRHFEDLSFKEIAALMNTSINTSLGRMRYALMHLGRMAKAQEAFA